MTQHSPGDGPDIEQRLAAMEVALSSLIARVSRLEARLARDAESAALPPVVPRMPAMAPLEVKSSPEPSWRPVPPNARTTPDAPRRTPASLEHLLGRYGAIGFALLALLAGVGTFVSWAARQGLLGPELRVAGGYLLAAALAVGGLRLRATRHTFGNALLACALGVTFAATWGAGPSLGLMSTPVALGVVALASAALAWLALREDENVLFLFGALGAALAPFVVGEGEGEPMALAGYGVLVFLAAARGVGDRPWGGAVRLVLWAVPAYVASFAGFTGARAFETGVAWAMPAFALGLWLAALVAAPAHAPRFARWGTIGLLAAALDLDGRGPAEGATSLALALLGAVGGQLLLARAARREVAHTSAETDAPVQFLPVLPRLSLERAYFDALLLPVVALLVTIAVTPDGWLPARPGTTAPFISGYAWGAAWAVAAWAMAWRRERPVDGAERPSPWTATAAVSLAVGALSLIDRSSLVAATGFACGGAIALALGWRAGGPVRAFTGALGLLALAGAYAAGELATLAGRATYAPPLTTRASLIAAAVVAAVLVVRAILARAAGDDAGQRTTARALGAVAAIAAFLWGLAELEVAWSRDMSTLLGTVYVGVCGAVAIKAGQRFDSDWVRRAGLVLGAWCAVRTFALAGSVESTALRVGLYFLAAGIGLVVAWMYTAEKQRVVSSE